MAFIAFLGHKKTVGIYRLGASTTIGRSLDCDVYVPDIYVSRHHCRFERHEGSWRVVDLESSNGIWIGSKRQHAYILKPGDTLEIGTIAIVFNEGVPDQESNPAPFGMGFGVAELMDTICTEGIRPSDFSKQQSVRKKKFLERVRSRSESYDEDILPHVEDLEPWAREEWAELDMEIQLGEAQEEIVDWQPPIFNPTRRLALAHANGTLKEEDVPTSSVFAAGATISRVHDSIDEEVDRRLAEDLLTGGVVPRKSILTKISSWLPLGRKAAMKISDHEGIEFVPYTWRDRLKDTLAEKFDRGLDFVKLNPALAAGIVLGLAVGVGAFVKFVHIGKTVPAFYIPPKNVATASK